jgi:hypothetical protein
MRAAVPFVAVPGAPSDDGLAAEIAALADLDLHGLRVQWRKIVRKPAAEHLTRSILMRVIAYRMQVRRFGDLDAESVRALDKIARDHDRRHRSGLNKPKAALQVEPAPRDRRHRPGTMFLREHAGEMHRVIVSRDGFEWQGETYRSLSDIAKRITGTTWSGPKFFGLRDKARGSS